MRFRPDRHARRRASAALLTIIAVAAGSTLTALPASATALTPAPVHGSPAPDASSTASDSGRTPAGTPVSITVVLTPGDRAELRDIATSTDSTDSGDVNAVAPPIAHAPQVREALEQAGFTVAPDTDRWDLTATGTAEDAEELFNIHLTGVGEQMHPTSEPVMPAAFGGKATTVLGLDQRPVVSPTAVPGTPASTLTGAYGATSSANAGAGTTIATVQFSGWNANDLKTYAKAAGTAMPSYTQISVDGASTTRQTSSAGAFEVALDQQSLLAVAPKAAQRAYFADNSVQGMYDAYSQVAADVAQHGITAVSVSWLMCEPQLSASTIAVLEDAVDRVVASGATMFAASGDNGAYCTNGQKGVGYPASSPAVISVGGTSLTKSGTSYRETTWGNSLGSTGGGISSKFARPAYQSKTGISGTRRQTPDIAAIADPNTGPGIYSSVYGRWMLGGGTSLATPILAGELASTLSTRGCSVGIGDIHNALYAHPTAFRDITSGGNGTDTARKGYDLVTGLGTPQWGTLRSVLPTAAGCQQRSPVGTIDAVSAGYGTVNVRGWTYDSSDTSKSLTVKVTIAGIAAGTLSANTTRADVNKAKKITGNHGYSGTVKTNKQGTVPVCVTAVNIGAGADSLIGCKNIAVPTTSPEGAIGTVTGVLGGVKVSGYAYDRDDLSKPVTVVVTVGAHNTQLTANTARADVNKAKSITGNHGFAGTATTTKYGKQSVCVTAYNIGVGQTKSIGCKTVTIPDPSPTGTFDGASAKAGAVSVRGWTFDPNQTSTSTSVRVTVGGSTAGTLQANVVRADVNKAKKVTGRHGYSGTVPVNKAGNQRVCVIAKNLDAGADKTLGCRTVNIPSSNPTGRLDAASGGAGAVTVRGWAFDPNATSASLEGRVTVGGSTIGSITMNGARADVNKAKKVTGRHGYSVKLLSAKTGKQSVCVIAKNTGYGSDTRLGCKTITIADSTIRGGYDAASATTTGVTVRGWAYDTSATSRSINTAVSVDGKTVATVAANTTRADVNKAKHVSGKHGFNTTVKRTLTAGKHTVCVTGKNIGAGGDASLGCKTVIVTAPKPTPTPTPAPTKTPTPSPTKPATAAPDANAMPAAAPGWSRTFAEDFTDTATEGQFPSVYGNRFVAYDGFNDTSGAGKYSDDALSAADGTLRMRMHTDSAGQPTGAAIIPLVGGTWGGQTTARYDIRLRADPAAGYGVAGLLWSDTNTWTDGEVDFPEGALDGNVTLANHCPSSPAENCLHKDLDTTFDDWHTYTVERTASKLTFLIDGQVVASTDHDLPTEPLHFVLQAATHTSQKPAASATGNVEVAWMSVSEPTGK